ncbi:Nlrc3 [Symbiodinium sp. CCMP2592]|nr:Nlrc3 [Symbiodinium sp. CCMP2592]
MATEVREELERVSAETFCDIVESLRGNGITEEELQALLREVPTDGQGLLSCRQLVRQLVLRLQSRHTRDPARVGTGPLSRAFGRCFPGRPSEPGEVDQVVADEEFCHKYLPIAGEGQVSFRDLEGSLPNRAHQEASETPGEICCPALPRTTEAKEYDLADKSKLADFLEDADIQLGGPGIRRISKDALRIIVRNLKGDRFTVDMLQAETVCVASCASTHDPGRQGILQEVDPDGEGLLSCEELARCLRRPAPAPEPQESKRFDLAQKQGLADFLKEADIRLVRAHFIWKLHREGQRLPRRQEAESAYVESHTALVTHEEVQAWADGKAPEGTQIVSLSHCWESREHCDPYGYQVARLAKALTGKEWLFIDYVSLYQFQRLSQKQNVSFGRAMQHMHVLYCHEKSSTLRIESLTPEADIAAAERKQECLMMYHHPTGLVKPVPVTELVKNRTPYKQRGWCAAEREWSSTRTDTNLSREVDAPEGEKGGIAPMVPEAFRQSVANQLKFTHVDDVETVCRLQAEVYKEKAEMCKSLRLVDLGAEALDIALSGLERYPVLESLEIVHCELRPKLPLLLKVLKENKLPQLHLQHNELFEEGTLQVVEALALQLAALSVGHDRMGVAGVKALAEAVKQNHTLKQLSLAGAKLALLASQLQLQLDLTDSDLGNRVDVALARALRTGQVKGTVTHPAMEFLCMLEDEEFKELEEAPQKLELDLSDFGGGRGAERFRRLFGPLCRALPCLPEALRELVLDLRGHGDAFGAAGARALAAGVRHEKELQTLTLWLGGNSVGDQGTEALASALRELTQLKTLVLWLHENKIGPGITGLLPMSNTPKSLYPQILPVKWRAPPLRPEAQSAPRPWPRAFERCGNSKSSALIFRTTRSARASCGGWAGDEVALGLGVILLACISHKPRPNLHCPKSEEPGFCRCLHSQILSWPLSPGRGDAGATFVVESLSELQQLTDFTVFLQVIRLFVVESNRLSPGLGRDEAASSSLPLANPTGPGEEVRQKLWARLEALPAARKRIEL